MKNYLNYAKVNVDNAIYVFEKMKLDSTKGLDRVIEELESAKEYIEKAIKVAKERL